jgi:hypothetical protein
MDSPTMRCLHVSDLVAQPLPDGTVVWVEKQAADRFAAVEGGGSMPVILEADPKQPSRVCLPSGCVLWQQAGRAIPDELGLEVAALRKGLEATRARVKTLEGELQTLQAG